ncbi:MAG TPA: carbon-nitrogen hydrolase family protein [Longimicrobium sp.]|nr:carbon-nitrogen hydrolase family protein [Longimicrobium sp.]
MKVAAFQAPLLPPGSTEALDLIRERVRWCEAAGVEILCCPEGVLGGLADYAHQPASIAIDVASGQLDEILAPLASATVTTLLGFTELGRDGRLHNSAAVYHRGGVAGVYRKLHPAINRSVYTAGDATPVFTVGGLTFGIILCRDSVFPEPARRMVEQGAGGLFIPTNNGLPRSKARADRVAEAAHEVDVARATENGIWIVRADVAGEAGDHVSSGSTEIVAPDGAVIASALPFQADLIVAEIG